MLSRLVERKPKIYCNSVHGALVDLLQQTLLQSQPAVTLPGRSAGGRSHTLGEHSAASNFEDVLQILRESGWLTTDSEEASPTHLARVPHPGHAMTSWSSRISLSKVSPAAALLRTFLLLRVHYFRVGSQLPTVRLEANARSDSELDALYLIGDIFSERYNVRASFDRAESLVSLTLVGTSGFSNRGLSWNRSLYLLTRDVSVLSQPLREALESSHRPLVVPRVWTKDDTCVRVRLPLALHRRDHALGWLTHLQQIYEFPECSSVDPTQVDNCGSHWNIALTEQKNGEISAQGQDTAYVLWRRPSLPDEFIHIPFRSSATSALEPVRSQKSQEGHERLTMSMEPLGGASEIAANAYYYRMGHKGLLIDSGLDANRNGWLGLPELERVDQLDVMILTHAHLDHMGSLPVVLHAFPDLPVYCTQATRDILLPLLHDTVKIGGLRFKQTGEAPLLSRDMVNSLHIDRFRCVEPGQSYSVPEIPGLEIKVHNAGHIMGSIAVEMRLSDWHLLHTGDFSTFSQHSQKPFDISGLQAPHVVMEGTYSGRPKFDKAERQRNLNAFCDALHQAIDEHRCVLIPSFSVGRSQEMVSLIVDALQQNSATLGVPVYTVGMINRINALSCAAADWFHDGYVERVKQAEALKVDLNPRYTREDQRSERYKEAFADIASQGPAVIVSSHGMMAENTGSHSIAAAILQQQPLVDRIFLCGYMDPRTPGSRLKRRHHFPESIQFGVNDVVTRQAADTCIQEFSITSHASYEELMEVALHTATQTLTLIHGDGNALRTFAGALEERLAKRGQERQINVPTNGQRVSFGTASIPASWDFAEASVEPEVIVRAAGGALFHRRTKTRISPLLRSGRNAWLVLPIGQDAAELIVEHDENFDNVLYIEAYRNNVETYEERWVLYDSYQEGEDDSPHSQDRQGIDRRIESFSLDALDHVELFIETAAPYQQLDDTTYDFSVVAEIQPQRYALDAAQPVLWLKVAGHETPQLERLLEVDERYRQKREWTWKDLTWDPIRRELRVSLKKQMEAGTIDHLQVWLRWPSGYLQKGPAIGPFSINPHVMLEMPSQPLRVGETLHLPLYNFPPPGVVKLQNGHAQLTGASDLELCPHAMGQHTIHCLYRDRHNNLIHWPAATLNVQAGAEVDCASRVPLGEALQLTIHSILLEDLHGPLLLQHDEETAEKINPSSLPFTWEKTLHHPGQHSLQLLASNQHGTTFTLWKKEVTVLKPSQPPLHPLPELHSLQLFLEGCGIAPSSIEPGTTLRFGTEEGPLPTSWFRVDTSVAVREGLDCPLLSLTAERIEPTLDDLSTRVRDGNATLLLPGRYRLTLWSKQKEIHASEVVVATRQPKEIRQEKKPHRSKLQTLTSHEEDTFLSWLEQSLTSKSSTLPHAMFAHRSPKDGRLSYELLEAPSSSLTQAIWERIEQERAQQNPVAILYPGPEAPPIAERLLERLRTQNQSRDIPERLASLAHPVPSGAVTNSLETARFLRAYGLRTLTSKPPHSPGCIHDLASLYQSGADILFAPFDTARFLWSGDGQRYLHRFATMPSAPFPFCHSEKEREIVSHHLAALSNEWELQHSPASKQSKLVMTAATELGWHHPVEVNELHSIVSMALSRWAYSHHMDTMPQSWAEIYSEILSHEAPEPNPPASLLVLQLEQLWNNTPTERVRPMKEKIEGALQWLDLLR